MTQQRDGAHQRARPRLKVFQPSAMTTPAGTSRVHLLDLSATGALVHAGTPPEPGALVRIACGDEFRAARIAWADGNRFGVTFALPLRDEQVAALVDPAAPTQRAG